MLYPKSAVTAVFQDRLTACVESTPYPRTNPEECPFFEEPQRVLYHGMKMAHEDP